MDLVNHSDLTDLRVPVFQNSNMTMMSHSDVSSVPGSIPINFPMDNFAQRTMDVQESPVSDKHVGFAQTQMAVQHQHVQPFLHTEKVDAAHLSSEENDAAHLPSEENDAAHLPSNENYAAQLPKEENDDTLMDVSEEDIKTEKEEDEINFMETAHDTFIMIRNKEIKIREASDILGRPYSFVYKRYQKFRFNINGKDKKEYKEENYKENGKRRKPKKSRKKFKCEECPATFHTQYLINTHSKVHLEKNESHLCTSCGIVFAKLGPLMKHRIVVHDDALQCPHCEKQYTKISSYKFHINTHSDKRPFVCDECGKGFFSRVSLEDHHRQHTGEKPFMCGYCEKTFIAINNLNKHQKVHLKDPNIPRKKRAKKEPKSFECEECGRVFKTNYKLEQHKVIHTGERPHACDLCDARFNQKANLFRHKQIHTGQKPFKCNYCPAAFLRKIDLQRHDMAHTGIKPFKCTLCDYTCVKKPSLNYHMNTHTGKTPFKCEVGGCSAEFSNPNTLKQHKLKHFPAPLKTCKVCYENYPDLHSLKRHMVIHPGYEALSCKQCHKIFYEESTLNRHMHVHMYKPNRDKPKPKQVRQRRKNPAVKKADNSGNTQKMFSADHQVPAPAHNGNISQVPAAAAQNGNISIAQSWTTNAEGIQNIQKTFHHSFPANPYTNLNAWPPTTDPDELRHRLLSSFQY